jgi:membrane protein DedA with SNARE-associated domain
LPISELSGDRLKARVQHIDLFLAHYGYFAIFGLLMLGIVGPLIPDETILVLSGIAVHRGELLIGPTIGVAIAGSLCGISVSYMLGRTGAIYALERFGPSDQWVRRHMPKVEEWFHRYGKWTLFFGYFIAGLRHFTAVAAGISKLRARTFMLYAYPGGAIWVVCFVLIGYYAGAGWERIAHRLSHQTTIVAALMAAILAGIWLLRRKTRA